MSSWQPNLLPPTEELETRPVLKKLPAAHRALAELKGILVPGTSLKNQQTGEIVYMPPQDHDTILNLMSNLEQYLNDEALSDADPLV